MSRIGKQPIEIPAGISAKVDGNVLSFTKGNVKKELDFKGHVNVEVKDNQVVFTPKSDDRSSRAYWGTYRALANNIIIGLTQGFKKVLEINGVGYKAAMKGKTLEMALGYSHPVIFDAPEGIEIAVEKNTIVITGADKQVVGQVAAKIREFRPPEPYKGKGIKYSDERIIRKAGKTSKK
ncbi:50S ribosomal protein L6 [Campylobacter sp. RM12654]|uniref:50S ribosomal protein L6 n=1 Tax=Campylobacter sp. RM12654 TaxID=2735738 RepID=UPI003014B104|nr:50S ribosomal protein L6 [Campylobacter sp. RM12654]